MTACALDGLAASAAAAAAALNASRRGTSVVGASMRVACSRVAGASMRVVRSLWPRIACNEGPRGPVRAATHVHTAHRMRLCKLLAGLASDIMHLPPALYDAWAGL